MLTVSKICSAILATTLLLETTGCASIPDGLTETNLNDAIRAIVDRLVEEKLSDMKLQHAKEKKDLLKKIEMLEGKIHVMEEEQKRIKDFTDGLMGLNIEVENTTLTEQILESNPLNDRENVTDVTSLPALFPPPGRRVRRAVGQVAFSAYLTITHSNMQVGEAIKFDHVLLNDGNGYNPYTGAFTAPLSGTYLFSFHFDTRKLTFIRLVVNGVNQVDAVANPHTGVASRPSQSMGGNTAIVHVVHGQAVLVETYEVGDSETASSDSFRLCSFSGVLLY